MNTGMALGYGAGWLLGNSIIIIPLIAVIWLIISASKDKTKK